MTNPFDRNYYPKSIPESIVAGQFVGWKTDDEYDDADYGMKYVLIPIVGTGSNIEIEGTLETTDDGDCWIFEINSSTSAAWTLTSDDEYRFDKILTRVSDSEATSVATGFTRIFTSTSNRRTHAETMVIQINALLEGRAKSDVASYSIKSRSLTKLSIEELVNLRDYYTNEIRQTGGSVDTGKKRIKRNTVQVRFE